MKEKLIKTHKKGFDRRIKYLFVCSLALMASTIAVFLPLSINFKSQLKVNNTNERAKEEAKPKNLLILIND